MRVSTPDSVPPRTTPVFVSLVSLALIAAAVLMAGALAGAEKRNPKAPRGKPPPAPAPPNSILIPAYAFDRGNAKTFTNRWADAEPMVAFGGESPVVVEYDIDFPVVGEFAIHVRYAAQAARPVEFLLDGKQVADCCRTATGTWNTSGSRWEEVARVFVAQGKRTVTLRREGAFPHVVALRFDSSVPLPPDWKLERPHARKLNALHTPAPSWQPHVPTEANVAAVRRAIQDLIATFGPRYPQGADYLARLQTLDAQLAPLAAPDGRIDPRNKPAAKPIQQALVALQSEALLANPLLDFEKLLLVKRSNSSPKLGLPQNWQSNSSLPKSGFRDEIVVLSPVRPDGQLTTLFQPESGRFVGDVDLHYNAQKLLFSMIGSHDRWQVFEIGADGSGLRQLTGEQPDVDSYDACYLPDGRILFTSTACFVGVPCVYGSSHVATLYRMDADGRNIRQLCFDQEHDWCPTVLNNGRVLYSRWEYSDTPHSNTRLLFHMNPDGTEQMEYLGSNSYWPNAFFYARPIPGHPTKVVAVIGGHHAPPRMGELVLFDPERGRHEASGAVQRIPGYGRPVEALIQDGLTGGSWPKFLHPYPLSDKHFLVACKPTAGALWGLYLVDVFDNLVPIKQLPDFALLEPIPFRPTPPPPVLPDKVDLTRNDAVVYVPDIYVGDGLKGVPRGTVKQLRLFTYHFAYQGMGGLLGVVGMDGPWDIKRVLGTVPVHPDGSAKFRIPANTPISIQPLDAEGKAIQLMRSWMTAMPGETVQCAGCHERQNTAPPTKNTLALNQKPAEIQPWHGPTRGFHYGREVQPVIDKYCVGCHNGQPRSGGEPLIDLRGTDKIKDWKSVTPGNGGGRGGKFSVGYANLHRFVRRPGIESDYHVLEPMEFHADTTHLVQLLKYGHHNVQLDAEAWDRLITWIDLNCPYHGTWGEELAKPGEQVARRRDLLKRYANVDDDPEAVPPAASDPVEPIVPEPEQVARPPRVTCSNWPFAAAEAERRQAAAGPQTQRTIDLGDGATIELVLVPAGEFVMGSANGEPNERPQHVVRITRPFWMARGEITNRVFARFEPGHDSRVEDKNTYQFGIHGYPSNQPEQPVVRVSWTEAIAFCRWLADKTGERFSLPTEAQWEYACRSGTATPFFFGDRDADFSKFANLADAKLSEFASNPYTVDRPLANPTKYDDWIPKDSRFHDGALLTVEPGRYQPNAWGLWDLHGNVAEWTRTAYRPYPYRTDDGRDSGLPDESKVVRGGSWRDEPKRATSGFRLSYLPWQRVYNVGFRVVSGTTP
jgi:formylglycine-generating enzyme required for sulfatase activity